MKAIVLHSGGLDSTVALSLAVADGANEVLSLGFMYGSKHNGAEATAANRIVSYYAHSPLSPLIARRVIDLTPLDLFRGGLSALMGDIPMPKDQTYQDIHNATVGESPTVVAYRNGLFLSMAAVVAEIGGYEWIYVGMHGEDAHNWAYPDCTPEFLGSQAAAIYVGTYHRVRVRFPLDFVDKAEVIRIGALHNAPLDLTWSCYDPVRLDPYWIQCGRCPTCMERKSAFDRSGFLDPTHYADM